MSPENPNQAKLNEVQGGYNSRPKFSKKSLKTVQQPKDKEFTEKKEKPVENRKVSEPWVDQTEFNPFKPRKEIPHDFPQCQKAMVEKIENLRQSDIEIEQLQKELKKSTTIQKIYNEG